MLVGNQEAINMAIDEIEKRFVINRIGKLREDVGCTVIEKDNILYLHQPDLITKLEKTFKEEMNETRTHSTPTGPGKSVEQKNKTTNLMTENRQKKFRSGVGMLLYLVKHSRPDISNSVRELSKVMDGALEEHNKMLLRVINYVINTKEKGVMLNPSIKLSGQFEIKAYSDSDYSGDRNTRLSFTGYIVFFNGAPVAWKSKAQRSVTLSSTEAEYMALSEMVTEIVFMKQVLEFLGIKIEFPIKVRVDNVKAIYLANNFTTSQCTKHVDTRYHFVREFIDDGILKIRFVKLAENVADVYTKNTGDMIFKKLMEDYTEEVPIG